MGQATIFNGQKIKTLKDTLTLNGKSDIISSTFDPTASAVDAPIGSLLINQTSGKLYRKLDAGSSTNWEEVGAGVGGINYILNPFAEVNTTGWATYADAAGTAPVDGTGGSPNVTWTRSTTSPLRGVADFNLVKDAANRQGQGVSYDFTIDDADKAKVLSVTFDYEVLSGTYADGDLTVYLIADPTGTPVVIQPAGYTVQAATVGTTMKQIATFQTQATGTSYRLCFHIASTSASAYTLAIDNVVVGPQQVVYGSPVTDWVSYTPTVTSSSGSITNYTATGKYRRVGDSIEISGNIIFSAASAVFSNVIVSIPTGLTIDSTKTSSLRYGSATILDSGVTYYPAEVIGASATTVSIFTGNSSGTYLNDNNITNAIPITFGLNDSISFIFTVPVSGLSSSVQMSNDTDTRVVAASATQNFAGAAVVTGTTLKWTSNITQTHGTYDSSTGIFTAPVSGFYEVSAIVGWYSSADCQIALSLQKNGSGSDCQFKARNNATNNVCNHLLERLIYLNANDNIRVIITVDAGAATYISASDSSAISIKRLSGPATIAASETVSFSAYGSSTSIANGSLDVMKVITSATVLTDSHAAYNQSLGTYTVPVSGRYLINGNGAINATLIHFRFGFSVDDLTNYANLDQTYAETAGVIEPASFSSIVPLRAGQIIRFGASHGSATPQGMLNDGRFNFVNITRVGN